MRRRDSFNVSTCSAQKATKATVPGSLINKFFNAEEKWRVSMCDDWGWADRTPTAAALSSSGPSTDGWQPLFIDLAAINEIAVPAIPDHFKRTASKYTRSLPSGNIWPQQIRYTVHRWICGRIHWRWHIDARQNKNREKKMKRKCKPATGAAKEKLIIKERKIRILKNQFQAIQKRRRDQTAKIASSTSDKELIIIWQQSRYTPDDTDDGKSLISYSV